MIIIGIDEVGRGPIAGPVTVCALALLKPLPRAFFVGLADSKKLSRQRREVWFTKIQNERKRGSVVYAVSSCSAKMIDTIGIAPAIQKALTRSLKKLALPPSKVQVYLDGGLKAPGLYINQKTVIKGDEKIPAISLASIVAKVTRDRYMFRMASLHPSHGFEKHVGYGTKIHYERIKKYGLIPLHRKTFLKSFVLNKK
jgi:ribonuclease HII